MADVAAEAGRDAYQYAEQKKNNAVSFVQRMISNNTRDLLNKFKHPEKDQKTQNQEAQNMSGNAKDEHPNGSDAKDENNYSEFNETLGQKNSQAAGNLSADEPVMNIDQITADRETFERLDELSAIKPEQRLDYLEKNAPEVTADLREKWLAKGEDGKSAAENSLTAELGKDGQDKVTRVIDQNKDKLGEVGDKAKSLWANAKDAAKQGTEKAKEALEKFMDYMKQNPQFGNLIMQAINPAWAMSPMAQAINFYEMSKNSINENLTDVMSYNEEQYKNISDTLGEHFNIDKSKPLSEEIGKLMERPDIADQKARLAGIQDYAKQVEDSFRSLGKAAFSENKEQAGVHIEKMKESLGKLEKTGREIAEKEGRMTPETAKKLQKTKEALDVPMKATLEKGNGSLKDTATLMKRIMEILKKVVTEGVKKTIQQAVQAAANSNPYSAIAYKAVQEAAKVVSNKIDKEKKANEKTQEALNQQGDADVAKKTSQNQTDQAPKSMNNKLEKVGLRQDEGRSR